MSDNRMDGRLRWVHALTQGAEGVTVAEIERRLNQTCVAVVIGPDEADTLAAQTTALTAVNLLARLFRHLAIVAPQGVPVHPNMPFISGEIGPALAAFAPRAHADAHASLLGAPPTDAVILHISDATAPGARRSIHCRGLNWVASVARHPICPSSAAEDAANPVGPLIAAALGVAEIFKVVFGDTVSHSAVDDTVTFSALTYGIGEPAPDPALGAITLPGTTLVGAGSIGSAFLWGLAHMRPVRGHLMIVDHDHLKAHNPDRAILIIDRAAEAELGKATWARDMISPWLPNLAVEPFEGTIRAYVDSLPADYTLPLAISAVDSVESRRDIQDALPQHILNASTGPSSIDLSRHGFVDGFACLYCVYLPDILSRSAVHIAMERTGFSERVATEYMTDDTRRLTQGMIRGIEKWNGLPEGALTSFVGGRLPHLLRVIGYSEISIRADSGHALVAAAFVSAMAGFLLLAETIKESVLALASYRLQRRYEQGLLGIPNDFRYASAADRTGYCLCADPWRRALYCEKYGDRFLANDT